MTKDKPIDLAAVRRARAELEKLIKVHPELAAHATQERLAALLADESTLEMHAQRAELSALFSKLKTLDGSAGLDRALGDDDRINFVLKLNALVSTPGKECPDDGENDD